MLIHLTVMNAISELLNEKEFHGFGASKNISVLIDVGSSPQHNANQSAVLSFVRTIQPQGQ